MAKKILEKKAKWFNLSETVEAIRNAVLELKERGTEGPAGKDGKDGADGHPTEAEWNALVNRVQTLETNVLGPTE